MKDAIYFPVLRGRHGEIDAVAALRPSTKIGIRPMFDLPVMDQNEPTTTFLSMLTSNLARTWGTALPLYIDLSRHDPDARFGEKSVVVHLFDCARQTGLMAIPVSAPARDRQGRTGTYFDGIANTLRKDQRGVAIRIDFDYFSDDVDSLEELITESIRAVDGTEETTDVFLDSGPLDKLPLGIPLSRSLMMAYSLALLALESHHFRNIIMCASNIPRKVSEISNGAPHRVDNCEFAVWNQLVGHKNNRILKFADYGARYAHQKDRGGGSRPPARIQLVTEKQHHLYLDQPDKYRELCAAAMLNEEFSHQAWGTQDLRDCARGNGNYGGGKEWVERDTLMHLEMLTALIRSRLSDLGALAALDLPKPERVPHDQAELLLFD